MMRSKRRVTLLVAMLVGIIWGPSALAEMARLTPAEEKVFVGSPVDALNKPPCEGTTNAATRYCRDPYSHLHTNEWHHHVWMPYIRGLRGGYVGVGADQGLSFVAAARSELAWMVDYDPRVVALDRLHVFLIARSPTPADFLARWEQPAREGVLALIAQEAAAEHVKELKSTYRGVRRTMRTHFRRVMRMEKKQPFHWLHDTKGYAHIRMLVRSGRVRVMAADLLKEQGLRGIGAAAKALKVTVRVLYLSNAEDYWRYTPIFRTNMRGLPLDARSRVLRTRTDRKSHRLGRYQYVVQGGLDYQRKLGEKSMRGVWVMMREQKPTKVEGVVTVGLGKESRE
ncbi:MAG: hypothetical protein JRH20_06485 [Deltaproteobacteria bacterium]|nr:hypothetical protein [Deltaproteobacteria bacterium]